MLLSKMQVLALLSNDFQWCSWTRLRLSTMLLEYWTPSLPKRTKSLQQYSKPKFLGRLDWGRQEAPCTVIMLGGPVYRNHIVGTLKILLCPLHITHWVKAAWCYQPDVLHKASHQIALKVPEVVGTENRVTSNPPFLLD